MIACAKIPHPGAAGSLQPVCMISRAIVFEFTRKNGTEKARKAFLPFASILHHLTYFVKEISPKEQEKGRFF